MKYDHSNSAFKHHISTKLNTKQSKNKQKPTKNRETFTEQYFYSKGDPITQIL